MGYLSKLCEQKGWHHLDQMGVNVAFGARSYRTPEPRFSASNFPYRTTFGRVEQAFDGRRGLHVLAESTCLALREIRCVDHLFQEQRRVTSRAASPQHWFRSNIKYRGCRKCRAASLVSPGCRCMTSQGLKPDFLLRAWKRSLCPRTVFLGCAEGFYKLLYRSRGLGVSRLQGVALFEDAAGGVHPKPQILNPKPRP